jgi:hypothetical protein
MDRLRACSLACRNQVVRRCAARTDSGFWLEQTLFQALESWRSLGPRQRKLHFWRNRSGHEVDPICTSRPHKYSKQTIDQAILLKIHHVTHKNIFVDFAKWPI